METHIIDYGGKGTKEKSKCSHKRRMISGSGHATRKRSQGSGYVTIDQKKTPNIRGGNPEGQLMEEGRERIYSTCSREPLHGWKFVGDEGIL